VYRRGHGIRRGKPLGVGGCQGIVDLGAAGRAVIGQHLAGQGQDHVPVPARVGRAGGDELPQLRLVAAQELPAGDVEQAGQCGLFRRRRGKLLGAPGSSCRDRVRTGHALVGNVLTHALSSVGHHPVEIAAQVVDWPAGGRPRHDEPGLLEQVLSKIARQPLRVPAHAGIVPDGVQLVIFTGRGRLPAVSRRFEIPGTIQSGQVREIFVRHDSRLIRELP
jgi:hypothetical protein